MRHFIAIVILVLVLGCNKDKKKEPTPPPANVEKALTGVRYEGEKLGCKEYWENPVEHPDGELYCGKRSLASNGDSDIIKDTNNTPVILDINGSK